MWESKLAIKSTKMEQGEQRNATWIWIRLGLAAVVSESFSDSYSMVEYGLYQMLIIALMKRNHIHMQLLQRGE